MNVSGTIMHVELDDIFASSTSECFFFKLVLVMIFFLRYLSDQVYAISVYIIVDQV